MHGTFNPSSRFPSGVKVTHNMDDYYIERGWVIDVSFGHSNMWNMETGLTLDEALALAAALIQAAREEIDLNRVQATATQSLED